MRYRTRTRTADLVTGDPRHREYFRHLLPTVMKAATVLLILVSLLTLVLLLSEAARRDLQTAERYQATFAEIDCPVPDGQSKQAFLEDVQYLHALPDRFSLLDEKAVQRIRSAFAAHPAVSEVSSMSIQPNGIRIDLAFHPESLPTRRTPIRLAVR